ILMTVPIAWGTFEPAVRFVYKYQPQMPPLAFSFAYYLVATSVLILFDTTTMLTTFNDNTSANNNNWKKIPLSIRGGIELGTYLFIGNSLQVIGLKTVPSDRAAFLLQLTTIFVPILKISLKTWIACFVALTGVALIGLDNNNDGSSSYISSNNDNVQLLQHVPVFSIEDGYIVLGAISYTFHCIRLETYAKLLSPLQLATAKAVTETIWSGVVVGSIVNNNNNNNGGGGGGEGWYTVGLATLWTGSITVAYTIFAQSFGQAVVPAVTANLIYTTQPFFTAIVAYLLLGERLGTYGYTGGILIGVAVLFVVTTEEE
ncbi:hypothetical protein FRACYDRAFT_158903, partial [Fragilariopsis cylindrus CCMP1102]